MAKWKWNESGFRPPLCTYRLNWARRTSWGWWDDWDDTVLQTQDSKFEGGGPRVVVSTAAFHARVRGSVPGLGGLKETRLFLPHPRVKVSIVGSLRDREVACSASDRQGPIFESCVWRTVSSQSSHHPQEVLLAQFSLYVHKGGLKPDSFHFISKFEPWRSETEHATSRSRRLPTILTFTRGWGRNNFVSFKPPRPGTEPRTLAWKAAVLTTTLGPPPSKMANSSDCWPNPFKPEFTIVMFIHYKPRIAVAILAF